MKALIVGADRIDGIRAEIFRHAEAFDRPGCINHWNGRKVGDSLREIPSDTRLIVIVCDRASHMLMRSVRNQALRRNIPIVFCRHSATELRQRLGELSGAFGEAETPRRRVS
ncbi:MAG: DUF2325 domain-containing protein [Zoogloea sp.]|nr:DUF2325 domain-containing protein [Zoogloea sp.]